MNGLPGPTQPRETSMRFYAGQRFVALFGEGRRELVTTREQYAGGPVVCQAGEAVFPTHVVARMLDAGSAIPDHSCLNDGLADQPAFRRAERCARCQMLGGL